MGPLPRPLSVDPQTPPLAPCGFVHCCSSREEALTRSLARPFTLPSFRVEAVGEFRGRSKAHLHCQPL